MRQDPARGVPIGGGRRRIGVARHLAGAAAARTEPLFVWQVPSGEGSAFVRNHPLLKGVALPERLGSENHAGPMVTKGGLVFGPAGERRSRFPEVGTRRLYLRAPRTSDATA